MVCGWVIVGVHGCIRTFVQSSISFPRRRHGPHAQEGDPNQEQPAGHGVLVAPAVAEGLHEEGDGGVHEGRDGEDQA